MPKWTPEQNELLMQCSNLGAKACRDLIRQKLGVKHTVEATARHGRRLGLSMAKTPNPCPICGSTHEIQASGFCKTCHYGYLKDKQLTYRRDLEAERWERFRAKREYNRVRKENERFAKENKLRSLRKWESDNK